MYARAAATAQYVCDEEFLVLSTRPQYSTYGYLVHLSTASVGGYVGP